MAFEEQVIVLGGDNDQVPSPERPETNRSPLWVVGLVVAVLAGLIAVFVIPQNDRATTTDPDGLEAPKEPPSAFVRPAVDEDAVQPYDAHRVGFDGTGGVTSVDHGPDGWLAVSAGAAVVAHTSENAILWEPSTIHGMVGEHPVAAVGDGVLAVVGSSSHGVTDGLSQVGATSTDFGRSWSPIVNEGPTLVTDVEVIDDRVYVAGATGAEPGSDIEVTGTAAMWEVVDGRLIPIELTSAESPSIVTSIVETDLGVMAFGSVDSTAARWTIEGERQHLITPIDASTYRFVAVEQANDGLAALVGRTASHSGWRTWVSQDGFEWTEPNGGSLGRALTDVAVTENGELVGPTVSGEDVWLGERGVTGAGQLSGGDGDALRAWITAVESADGITIFGGVSDIDPVLFVHGTTVHPVEVTPAIGSEAPHWRTELTIDLGPEGPESIARPLASARVEDTILVATTTHVFEVDVSDDLSVTPFAEQLRNLGSSGTGIWVAAVGPGNQTELHLREPPEPWRAISSPVHDVIGVGRVDGVLTVTGWGSAGIGAYQQTGDGLWAASNDPSQVEHVPIFPIGDTLLGIGASSDPFDTPPAVTSRNGQDWDPIDGWTVLWGFGSHPFLRSLDDASVVANPTSLPDLHPFTMPTTAPDVRLWPWGDRAIVQDPWFVHVPDGSGWQSFPIDVEHGVAREAITLPGDTPRLAMVDDGALIFLVWK